MAGIRPYRRHSIRIEAEPREDRFVFHNYGHGGAGITLCWGSALECLEMVGRRLSPPATVTVLGAGIIGLTTALLLLREGFSVKIVAQDFPPHTTSDIAGGLWAPACVAGGRSPQERELYQRLVSRSRDYYEEHPHPSVYPSPLYVTDPESELNETMGRGEPMPDGRRWPTLLVETATFLPWLLEQVREAGAETEQRSVPDFSDQPGDLVNCLGLGAAALTGDEYLMPVRGQLVYLDPFRESFAWEHPQGYLIGRQDVLVVGGTEEEGVTDTAPVNEDCRQILERHRHWLAEHPSPVTNLKHFFNKFVT